MADGVQSSASPFVARQPYPRGVCSKAGWWLLTFHLVELWGQVTRTLNGRSLRDRRDEVLFVDLRRWNETVYEKKYVMFSENQIAAIKKIYNNWQSADTTLYHDVPELCKSATIEDIKAQGYSLAPSKYIEFIDHDLDIDYAKEMARIQDEMRLLIESEKLSQSMLEDAFRGIGYGID